MRNNVLEYYDVVPFIKICASYGLLIPYIKLTYQDDSYMKEYADKIITQLHACKDFAIKNNFSFKSIINNFTFSWEGKSTFTKLLKDVIEKENEKGRYYYIDEDIIQNMSSIFFDIKKKNCVYLMSIFYKFMKTDDKDLIYSLPYFFDKNYFHELKKEDIIKIDIFTLMCLRKY